MKLHFGNLHMDNRSFQVPGVPHIDLKTANEPLAAALGRVRTKQKSYVCFLIAIPEECISPPYSHTAHTSLLENLENLYLIT